jgi:predicted house-cleaning noncanonical NTP pyrophosphatase (MazG superfamily)
VSRERKADVTYETEKLSMLAGALEGQLKEFRAMFDREREKTKKLVEVLMQIAELPGQNKASGIAHAAVEKWLKP